MTKSCRKARPANCTDCSKTRGQEFKRYCRQRGWKNAAIYTDRISWAKASRPELDRLMHDFRAGKIERLVVCKLDRLGRSLMHLALILDELNRLRAPRALLNQLSMLMKPTL